MDLFLSHEGRIGRGKWWLGVVILIVVGVALFFLFPAMMTNPWMTLIVQLIFLYPAGCLYLKRLHDRNKPATPWLWIFLVPGILMSIASALGIGFEPVEFGGITTMQPTGIGWVLNLATMVVGLWAIVELGFLRGTRGSNDFGPDPVGE